MRRIALIVLLCLCLTPGLRAQAGDVEEYDVRLETKYGYEFTKLAVADFTGQVGERIDRSQSIILTRIAEIIRSDLHFSPYYMVIELDSLYLRTYELETMNLTGWNHLGARYLVEGEGEFDGENMSINYKVLDTQTGIEVGRGRIRAKTADFRYTAHRISNEIILALTGEPGIFTTRICFISERTGHKELYLADFDGANIYRLTSSQSISMSPSFSPDNKKIIYTSFVGGRAMLYQYDVFTGQNDLLAGYPGINSGGAVSPDNNWVAATLSRDGNPELYLLYRDGRIKRRLTYTAAIESSPSWSPRSKEIVFSSDRTGSPQLYIMDREGTNLRRLTYQGVYNDSPDWSPNGDKIVFVSRINGNLHICTIDVTGENFAQLSHYGNNENPYWSPDGNHIIFSSNRTGEWEIYIMDAFGRKAKRLTTGGGNTSPAWSRQSR